MKALNSTLVARRAGERDCGGWKTVGRRRGKGRREEEAKFMPPNPFFKKQRTTIAAAAARVPSVARSLARFGNINVRTNERGTHNKYEFLYCPPAALRRRHWRRWRHRTEPGSRDLVRLRVQNYEIVCFVFAKYLYAAFQSKGIVPSSLAVCWTTSPVHSTTTAEGT